MYNINLRKVDFVGHLHSCSHNKSHFDIIYGLGWPCYQNPKLLDFVWRLSQVLDAQVHIHLTSLWKLNRPRIVTSCVGAMSFHSAIVVLEDYISLLQI